MKTVLVTRPEPSASASAIKLRALGFDAVILPLTEIRPLTYSVPDNRFDAVVISSGQAVRMLPQSSPVDWLSTPLFAVGKASGEAALQAGFLNVSHKSRDAASLIIEIIKTVPAGSRLLYLCGKVRRPDIEAALSKAGYNITSIETYDTVPLAYDFTALSNILAGRHIDMAFVTSVQSAQALNQLTMLKQTHFLCLSQRIADALLGGKSDFIHVSDDPNEESLLNLAMRVAKLGSAL